MKKVSILNQTYLVNGKDEDQYFHDIPTVIPFTESYFNFMTGVVKEDSVCLDIGANIGLVSLAISQLNPKSKVYAFEPTPEVYPYLKENIEINGIKNIIPFKLALSDKKQKLSFINVKNYLAGNFSLNPKYSDKEKKVYGDFIQLDAVKLDDWAKKNKIKKIDFIKLDVEGAELHVLKGAKEILKKHKPLLVMEFNSYCYIKFQNKTPMDALEEVMSYFKEIYKINKSNSSLQKIPYTEKAKMEFIEASLRNGFVDDLVCIPHGRELPAYKGVPMSFL